MVSMSGVSVVVVGDTMCGKTQLINRFANRTFDQVTTLTLSIFYHNKRMA